MKEPDIKITKEILRLIAEIDEFKGQWKALGNLAPERLDALKKVATVESVGSSTRIEGAKLTDLEVEKLLSGLEVGSFQSRDEEEVAGYPSQSKHHKSAAESACCRRFSCQARQGKRDVVYTIIVNYPLP